MKIGGIDLVTLLWVRTFCDGDYLVACDISEDIHDATGPSRFNAIDAFVGSNPEVSLSVVNQKVVGLRIGRCPVYIRGNLFPDFIFGGPENRPVFTFFHNVD